MISSFVKKLFLILPLIGSSNQSKDTCNGSCLTKTYRSQGLASVTFAVKQIEGTILLNIILVGYNIKETEDKQIIVMIDSDSNTNIYACERNSSGYINSYFEHAFKQFPSGSSLYRDETLHCFWTMNKAMDNWPKESDGTALDLVANSDYKIILTNDDISFLVATSTEDLPIYQLKFLKCCNMVYGNDQVQLFVRQTDNSNDFTLQLLNSSSPTLDIVEIRFIGSDESQIVFGLYKPHVKIAYFLLGTDDFGVFPSRTQILYNYAWSPGICSWSIPIVIKSISQDYDTRDHVYQLTIFFNGKLFYKRSDISLISFASTETSSLFFVLTVFLFHQFLQ